MSGIGPHGLPPFEEIAAALGAEAPRRWGLRGVRRLGLLAEPTTSSIWLVVPREGVSAPTLPTGAITARQREIGGIPYILLGSAGGPQREVYYFICSLVDRLEAGVEDLTTALESELSAWSELLSRASVMDVTKQIGLLGELWVLWRVIASSGPRLAVRSWTGPLAEPHDFRLDGADIEVKTTLSTQRIHTINGLSQLAPDGDRPLLIISLQVKPAGAGPGTSLCEAIDAVTRRLDADPVCLAAFRRTLLAHGYKESERDRYTSRYSMRSSPMLVPLDERVPRLTREVVSRTLTKEAALRFVNATYRINLDRLGNELEKELPLHLQRPPDGDLYD